MGKKEVYSKKCREKVKIKYKWRLFFTNMTLPDNLSPENQQLSPQISQTLFWAWDKGAGLTELKGWVLEKIAAESSSADALAASTDRAVIEKMRSALMRCDGAMEVGNVVTQRSASGRMPCWEQDLLLKRFWSQD